MDDDKMKHSQAPGSGLEPLDTGEEGCASPQEPQSESLTKDGTDALIREIEAMTDAELQQALVYERAEREALLKRKEELLRENAKLLQEQEELAIKIAEKIVRGKIAEAAREERDKMQTALIKELQAKEAELIRDISRLKAQRDSGRSASKAGPNE
ncbi:hypothetical protein CKM354_000625100 [Cercospora kikuchii]|uniref:Uncharacterized protein n=1 Tax=Cercospora kikuchii TaxID=84275 RepID=A0A9P3FI14_9PEZI|nr:uncharacterized protein CKM354_000625100 [Cercospora kikuchii]GIZ43005.1 hypothetical protein CKM354_000625100 [Cercospora kikuchii]